MQPLLQGGIAACIRLRERRYLPKFEKIPPQQNFMSWTRRLNCGWMNWFSAWFHQRNSNKKISEVNTVAFLPTARIFKDLEGVYLLENNGRGERIWTSDPLVPNQIPTLVEIYGFLLFLSNCCWTVCGLLVWTLLNLVEAECFRSYKIIYRERLS